MLRYVARLACMSLWRHGAMSSVAVMTTSVLLLLLSGFLIIMTSLNVSIAALQSKVNVTVYLKDDLGDTALQEIETTLRADPGVQKVSYASKADALKRLQRDFADRPALIQAVEGNPLPASFEVVLQDPARSQQFADTIRDRAGVEDVDFKQDTVKRLLTITSFVRASGLALMAGLTAAVVLIMINIARMGIYARRQEIEIMRLVGATDWFVRWPFIVEGVLCGLLAAILATGVLSLGYHRIIASVSTVLAFLPLTFDPIFLYKLAAISLVIGVAVGGGGSLFAVRRFWEEAS